MERTTQILNVCTLILIVITGLYIHQQFNWILSDFSLIMLWGTIVLLVSLHLEYTFEITTWLRIKIIK